MEETHEIFEGSRKQNSVRQLQIPRGGYLMTSETYIKSTLYGFGN